MSVWQRWITCRRACIRFKYADGELVRDHGHLALRKDLWKKAFPSCRNINPESRVPNPSVAGEVTQLISKETLPAVMGVMSGANASAIMSGRANTNIDAPGISEKLKNMREFAVATAKRAKSDKLKFYEKYKTAGTERSYSELNDKQLAVNNFAAVKQSAIEFADIHQKTIETYVDGTCTEIDIDDVIHSFSTLLNEPAIMRLMGLILDVEIDLPSEFIPNPGSPIYFYLKIEMDATKDIGSIPTKIKAICNNDKTKYAYLVAEDETANQPQFFENSILKAEAASNDGTWKSDFCLYDKVAQEFRLQGIHDAKSNDSGVTGDDPCDAFTRGIIFCNLGLHKSSPCSVKRTGRSKMICLLPNLMCHMAIELVPSFAVSTTR